VTHTQEAQREQEN